MIAVEDDGVGIDESDQARIFQPFERVKTAQQNSRGAGLGLTLVSNIVSLHNGRFALDSVVGEGTTVSLFLPRGQKDD